MFHRRAVLILVMALVLTVILAGVILRRERLYSDPAAPRKSPSYDLAHRIVTNSPPVYTNELRSLLVSSNAGEIRIQLPAVLASPEEFQHPFSLAEGTNIIRIGTAAVELRTIGIAYTTNLTGMERTTSQPRYYSPLGELQDRNAIRDLVEPWEGNLQSRGTFPRATFSFKATDMPPDVLILGFSVFDQRTRQLLTSGYSSSVATYRGTTLWIAADVQLWHQTPLEVVLTIATGPAQTSTRPIEDGMLIPFPGGLLKLVHIEDGRINGWGTDFIGSTNFVTLMPSSRSDPPITSLCFYLWPKAPGTPIQLQLVGHDDNPLQHVGSSHSDELMIASVEAPREQVAALQLRYYPQIYRLIFHLPELPGLPDENRGLRNLFDTHIASIRFAHDFDYQNTLRKLIAMEGIHLPLTYSNSFFPLLRTNTTVRALFRELQALSSAPDRVIVADPIKNEVRSEPSPVLSALQKLKQRLGW